MAILDDVKIVLRITNTAYDTEITDLINAAIADLQLSGVTAESAVDTDVLIKRAINTYVKAHFGWSNPDAERLHQAYEMLKGHLTLAGDYSYYKVNFEVTDLSTGAEIREAEITFNDKTKETNADGEAVFYVRAGDNYEYKITAEGYQSETEIIDIAASQTVAVSLLAV